MSPGRKAFVAVGVTAATLAGVMVVSASITKPQAELVVPDVAGPDPVASLRALTVPVALTDPAQAGCVDGTAAFGNPVVGYTLCYPTQWGFTTLETPEALTRLDGTMLGSVRLLSQDAFPWEVGAFPLGVVASRDIIDLEISRVPHERPNAVDTGDCTPLEPIGLALGCDQRIDPNSGAPNEAGAVTELFAVIAPTLPDEEQIVIRGRYLSAAKRGTIVRIVASMRRSKREAA